MYDGGGKKTDDWIIALGYSRSGTVPIVGSRIL